MKRTSRHDRIEKHPACRSTHRACKEWQTDVLTDRKDIQIRQGYSVNKHLIKYIASLLIFASNGIVARHIALNSYQIVLLRTLIGGLMMLALLVFGKKLHGPHPAKEMRFVVLSGISMGVSWNLMFTAYELVGVAVAALLDYCAPIFVLLLSIVFYREKLTWPVAIGCGAAVAGVLLLSSHTQLNGASPLGAACAILGALFYALEVLLTKKAETVNGMEITMWQLFIACAISFGFTLWRTGVPFAIEGGSWPYILWLGLVNTGVGCWLFFSSVPHMRAQTVAVCGYLQPMAAVVLAALLLRESLTPLQLMGAALVLTGAVCSGQTAKHPVKLRK